MYDDDDDYAKCQWSRRLYKPVYYTVPARALARRLANYLTRHNNELTVPAKNITWGEAFLMPPRVVSFKGSSGNFLTVRY